MFQFLIGRVQRFYMHTPFEILGSFNSLQVEFKAEAQGYEDCYHIMFQFLIGRVQRMSLGYDAIEIAQFQFLIGRVQSRLFRFQQSHHSLCFNSLQVEFKGLLYKSIHLKTLRFQFLIGRVQSFDLFQHSLMINRFNSLQVEFKGSFNGLSFANG